MKDSDNFAHCVSGYLCITIGGSDCAAERLPPHSSFIAGHNELIQVGNFFFFKSWMNGVTWLSFWAASRDRSGQPGWDALVNGVFLAV